jgi:hypothetical protein
VRRSAGVRRGVALTLAADYLLRQMNVKGFASRPNGSAVVASRHLFMLPKDGPTLDIDLASQGMAANGLMLGVQCWGSKS